MHTGHLRQCPNLEVSESRAKTRALTCYFLEAPSVGGGNGQSHWAGTWMALG